VDGQYCTRTGELKRIETNTIGYRSKTPFLHHFQTQISSFGGAQWTLAIPLGILGVYQSILEGICSIYVLLIVQKMARLNLQEEPSGMVIYTYVMVGATDYPLLLALL